MLANWIWFSIYRNCDFVIKWFLPAAILDFSEFVTEESPNIFISGFIRFFDFENIGVDTKIMILCQLELEILSKLDFHGGHFEKWPNPYFVARVVGGARWPILAHGL